MDNLTHSLAGLACGEIIHRCLTKEADEDRANLRRRLLLLSCWLASNFPDLDIVLTPLLPRPLGYLLHHRGHTHTFLYAVPQAIAVCLLFWAAWPAARRLLNRSSAARLGLALSVTVGLVLHLAMDYLNSYGIHPFHPFDSRWFYGDMVFIVEPVFWVAFGAPLIMLIPNKWLRGILFSGLAGTLWYFTNEGFLVWFSFIILMLAGAALSLWQIKTGSQSIRPIISGLLLGFSFILVQALASSEAKSIVTRQLQSGSPATLILDTAMTPFPANPLCWTFVSVESDAPAGLYHLHRGMLSLSPHLLPVASCPAGLVHARTQEKGLNKLVMLEHFKGKLEALRNLQRQNCHFSAWLRFARAPMFDDSQAQDMRFSSKFRDNFTTLRFKEFSQRPCSDFIPQWDFPRRDLLKAPEKHTQEQYQEH